MRSLVLSLALAVCAIALFSTVNAQTTSGSCVQRVFCIADDVFDPVTCQCVSTPAPTSAPGVHVVTLSFNVTATWNSHKDKQVRKHIIQSIRQIAIGDPNSDTNPGAGIDARDVKIDTRHVKRLTDYVKPVPTQNWYTATWFFKIGFTGRHVPGLNPTNGAKSEETQFAFQAFNEAATFNLTLKSLQAPTPTSQANIAGVQVVTGDDTTSTITFAVQADTINQATEIMTTHTCDDGTNIDATQACPVAQASSSSSSSSSSTRIGVLIGSIVGGVVVLLVVAGTVMMVIRCRHAANVKAMDRMQTQQEMTTQV